MEPIQIAPMIQLFPFDEVPYVDDVKDYNTSKVDALAQRVFGDPQELEALTITTEEMKKIREGS